MKVKNNENVFVAQFGRIPEEDSASTGTRMSERIWDSHSPLYNYTANAPTK